MQIPHVAAITYIDVSTYVIVSQCEYKCFLLSEINAIAINFIFIRFISIGCICDICDGNKVRTPALFELGAKLALDAPI